MTLKGFGRIFLLLVVCLLTLLMGPLFALSMGRLPIFNPWPVWRRKIHRRF